MGGSYGPDKIRVIDLAVLVVMLPRQPFFSLRKESAYIQERFVLCLTGKNDINLGDNHGTIRGN